MREEGLKEMELKCFKPYKGVSSNANSESNTNKEIKNVSNPIREYLQILLNLFKG